jgi:hypothetical protein
MNVKIKEFEKRVIDAVSDLRDLLGAMRVDVSISIDKYESECRTDVKFLTTSRREQIAERPVHGCGGCKCD